VHPSLRDHDENHTYKEINDHNEHMFSGLWRSSSKDRHKCGGVNNTSKFWKTERKRT